MFRGSSSHQSEYTDRSAYAWMVPQTASRIGPPPLEDALPVWAWLQRQDSRRARPNLRCSAHLPSETQVVRPEIGVLHQPRSIGNGHPLTLPINEPCSPQGLQRSVYVNHRATDDVSQINLRQRHVIALSIRQTNCLQAD